MKVTLRALYYLALGGIGVIGLMLVATLIPVPGNFEVKVVKSGSMEPAVRVGSVVVIKPAASYAAGDIITFGEDTKTQIPTTHRIVRVEGEGAQTMFVTKGDANDAEDSSPTSISKVKGKMVLTVPYAGYILAFARTKIGFFLLVGVPAAIIVIEEVLNIFKEMRRMRRRKLAEIDQTPAKPTTKSRKVMGMFAILGVFGMTYYAGLNADTAAFYANSAVSEGNLLRAGEFNIPDLRASVLGTFEVTTSDAVVSEEEPPAKETPVDEITTPEVEVGEFTVVPTPEESSPSQDPE